MRSAFRGGAPGAGKIVRAAANSDVGLTGARMPADLAGCQTPERIERLLMGYPSLRTCVEDLERGGHLVRVTEEVDPYLEMAAIHMRVFESGGPALLFERVKDCGFPAVSNLFGTMDRSRFIFRDTLERVKALVELKYDPVRALRSPRRYLPAGITATAELPRRRRR